MSQLMMRCSTTGREFYPGLSGYGDSFEKLPTSLKRAPFPVCDLRHEWSLRAVLPADARISHRWEGFLVVGGGLAWSISDPRSASG